MSDVRLGPARGSCFFEWNDGTMNHRCGEHRGHSGNHYCGDTASWSRTGRDGYVEAVTRECAHEFFVPPPVPSKVRND